MNYGRKEAREIRIMIYFARIEETGLIKVGATDNLSRRMNEHRHLYGRVSFLFAFDGDGDAESKIHWMLRNNRVGDQRSEHFRLSNDEIEDIRRKVLSLPGYRDAIKIPQEDVRCRPVTKKGKAFLYRCVERRWEKTVGMAKSKSVNGRIVSLTEILDEAIDLLDAVMKGEKRVI